MNHATIAITLYKIAAAIDALVHYCPDPVSTILKPHVAKLNHIADWHHNQARQTS